MRTLVLILNYNTSELTTNLFDQLIPFERNDYHLFVLDNGSTESIQSIDQSRIIFLEKNLFFGGGLNKAFDLILQNDKTYDSLLFLNSDLIVHGYNFVKELRNIIISEEFPEYNNTKIVSPCILQPEMIQNNWRQMHCHSKIFSRTVKWIDFQAPMFHIDFIRDVKRFPDELNYGWGLDLLAGMICSDLDYKISVLDYVPAIHLNSQTIKKNSMNDYCSKAERNMFDYFQKHDQLNLFHEYRNWAISYSID